MTALTLYGKWAVITLRRTRVNRCVTVEPMADFVIAVSKIIPMDTVAADAAMKYSASCGLEGIV